jgi:hypothetical protein
VKACGAQTALNTISTVSNKRAENPPPKLNRDALQNASDMVINVWKVMAKQQKPHLGYLGLCLL